jgi:hypothetical protein
MQPAPQVGSSHLSDDATLVMVRLADIHSKLDRLRRIGRDAPGLKAGGPSGNHYGSLPRLGAADLKLMESLYRVTLPVELRVFLQVVHGGGPGPGYGLAVDECSTSMQSAEHAFPYGNADAVSILRRRRADPSASLPLTRQVQPRQWPPGNGFLPVATHTGGAIDVLVVTGEQRGWVWRCDGGWFPRCNQHRQLGFLDWYEEWLDVQLRRPQWAS